MAIFGQFFFFFIFFFTHLLELIQEMGLKARWYFEKQNKNWLFFGQKIVKNGQKMAIFW